MVRMAGWAASVGQHKEPCLGASCSVPGKRGMRSCSGEWNGMGCQIRREAGSSRGEATAAAAEAERLAEALREVRGTLAQRRADATAATSRSAALGALMAAKASGALPGIRGRLGALCPGLGRFSCALAHAWPSSSSAQGLCL